MNIQTRSQKLAQAAYDAVAARRRSAEYPSAARRLSAEYASFARDFPTLVHSCGLAQAVAFARAKKKHQVEYLEDLGKVLKAAGHQTVETPDGFEARNRTDSVTDYLRLSRDALEAAVWVKRYVEALSAEKPASTREEAPHA